MTTIGLYLIQSYQLLTEALTSCLEQEPELRAVGSTQDPDRALRELASLPVDVVLIDATDNPQEALDLTFEIREAYDHLKILPLGVRSEEEAVAFLEAGAAAFLFQKADLPELLEMIKAVHRGGPILPSRVIASIWARVAALAGESHRRKKPKDVTLTPREQDILELIALGQRNKEIARQLNISLATVKNHVHHILDKLEVKRRREAIHWACERGILSCPFPTRPQDPRP